MPEKLRETEKGVFYARNYPQHTYVLQRMKSASGSTISAPVYNGDGTLVISARVFHGGEIFVVWSRVYQAQDTTGFSRTKVIRTHYWPAIHLVFTTIISFAARRP